MRASSAVFVLLFLCFTVGVGAQTGPTTLTTQPAAPTHLTPVSLVVSYCCPAYDELRLARSGSTFYIVYNDICVATCLPSSATYDLGPLPAGTYTVRHYRFDESPAAAEVLGTFVVGPAPAGAAIPTLGASSLALLALLLVASAVLVLRRRAS